MGKVLLCETHTHNDPNLQYKNNPTVAFNGFLLVARALHKGIHLRILMWIQWFLYCDVKHKKGYREYRIFVCSWMGNVNESSMPVFIKFRTHVTHRKKAYQMMGKYWRLYW